MNKKPHKSAIKAATNYLERKLGDRRGCKVLDGLDDELREELIEECAEAMQKYLEDNIVTKLEHE